MTLVVLVLPVTAHAESSAQILNRLNSLKDQNTAIKTEIAGMGSQHDANEIVSIYMHMTHFVVSAGQSVAAGQLIGYVGSTGVSTGPHLHFGISYAGTYVNPLAYVG